MADIVDDDGIKLRGSPVDLVMLRISLSLSLFLGLEVVASIITRDEMYYTVRRDRAIRERLMLMLFRATEPSIMSEYLGHYS